MPQHRDHRELGRLLDLFSFHDIAPGAPFWHANGMIVLRELEKLARQMNDDNGYQEISTPTLVKSEVFKKSGHWEHYRKNMFYFTNPEDENEELVIKPMNCPESTYIFNSTIRSYRDLPLRLAEIGRLHRNELSGTLGGLFRVRQLTMDDAHIYCRPDQVEEEIKTICRIIEQFYALFAFKPTYVLATRPDQRLGQGADWDQAEAALKNALDHCRIPYQMQTGEGAFYGPKIEVHLRDAQDRDWQMGTAQLDLVMLPKQFNVHYIDERGQQQMPWVIHRAIFGSFERFIGILLEQLDGNLPPRLAPVQAQILTVSDEQNAYGETLLRQWRAAGLRAELNRHNLTLNKKIREAEIQRVPYLAVVGDKEVQNKTISLRSRSEKTVTEMTSAEFLTKILTELS